MALNKVHLQQTGITNKMTEKVTSHEPKFSYMFTSPKECLASMIIKEDKAPLEKVPPSIKKEIQAN